MNLQQIRQQYRQYDDLSDTQLAGLLREKFYPDLSQEDFNKRIGLVTDSTIGGEFKRGAKGVVSALQTAGESITRSPEEAAIRGIERGQRIAEETGEGPSFERLKRVYEEKGLFDAGAQVLSDIPKVLAGQATNLAGMAGSAKLGAMAGSPLGPVGSGVGAAVGAGAYLLPQFFGSNVERQAQEDIEQKRPVDIETGKALASATLQAGVEGAGTAFVLGGKLVKSILGIAPEAAAGSKAAQAALVQAAKARIAGGVAKDVSMGALRGTAEVPVEVAQAIIERAQAGLDVLSEDAIKEYGENAYQAMLMGPVIGGAGNAATRGGARRTVEEDAQRQAAEAQAAAAEQERLRKESPDYLTDLEQRYAAARSALTSAQALKKPTLSDNPTPEQEVQYEEALAAYEAQAAANKDVVAQYKAVHAEYKEALPRLNARRQEIAAAEAQRGQDIEIDAARDQPMATDVERAPGEQQQLEGFSADQEGRDSGPSLTTEEEIDPNVERARLEREVRNFDQLLDQIRGANLNATTSAQKAPIAEQYAKIYAAREQAAAALDQLPIAGTAPALAPLRKQVSKLAAQVQQADEAGDVPRAAALQLKLEAAQKALAEYGGGAAQTEVPKGVFRDAGGQSESVDSFNQRVVGPEIGAAREARVAEEAARRETVDPEVEALQRIGQREDTTKYVQQAKQELLGRREVSEMEQQAAMDRTATSQGELFITPQTPTPVTRTLTPGRTTPEALGRMVEAAKTSGRLLPEDQQLLAEVEQTLPAMAASPDTRRLDTVASWLYRAALGNPNPDAARDVRGLLDTLRQGAGSEVERTTELQQRALTKDEKRALQGRTPGMKPGPVTNMTNRRGVMLSAPTGPEVTASQRPLPGMEPTATEFDNFKDFERYLASSALAEVRAAAGLDTDTVAYQMRNIDALDAYASRLRAEMDALVAQRDAARAEGTADQQAAAGFKKETEKRLFDLMSQVDAQLGAVQIKYLQSALKLAQAQQVSADLSAKVSENVAKLEQEITQYETQGVARDKAMAALIAARNELKVLTDAIADTKQYMATAMQNIANGLPLDINNARIKDAKTRLRMLQGQAVAAHQRLMQANAAVPTMPKLSTTAFRDFLIADGNMQAELGAAQARQTGFKAAHTRARKALDAAFTELYAQPEVVSALAEANSDLAIAEQLVESSRQGTDARVQPLDAKIQALGVMAEPVIRRLENMRRDLPKAAEARIAEQEARREGQREQRKEQRLETAKQERAIRQEGAEAGREGITFDRPSDRTLSSSQYKALEDVAADPDADLDDRRRAANTITDWVLGLDRKANEFANKTERLIEENLQRIDALQQYKEQNPAHVKKIAEREAVIKRALETLRKRAKVTRTPAMSKDEKRSAADALLRETRDTPLTDEDKVAVAAMPKGRAIGPATKKDSAAPNQLRSGSPESKAGENKTSPRNPITEARGSTKRNTAVSGKEQREANEVAADMRKRAEEAEKIAAKLKEPKKPVGKKTRVQAAIEEDSFDEYDSVDDAGFAGIDIDIDTDADFDTYASAVRGSDMYDSRPTEDLDAEAKEALFDGRIIDLADRLASDGSTPFVRAVAKRLSPLLLRTKLRTVENLVDENGVPVEALYDRASNTILVDTNATSEAAVLHEMVHAATLNNLTADPKTLTVEQQQARAELEQLFEQAKKDPAFSREYAKEDIGEFVAELMSNQQVRDKLDAMPRSFLRRVYDAILRMLGMSPSQTQAEKAAANAYALFAPSRASTGGVVASVLRGVFPGTAPKYAAFVPESVRSMSEPTAKATTIGQRITASALGFRTLAFDRWAPVEFLLKQGVSKGLIDETRAQQMRVHMRLHEDTNRFAAQALTSGVPQLQTDNGKRYYGGEASDINIRTVVSQLNEAGIGNTEATLNVWQRWMEIQRVERLGVGYDVINRSNPPTAAQVQEIKDFVANNPQVKDAFEKARETYRQYNKDLMRQSAEAGTLPKDVANRLADMDYIPFYRVSDNGSVILDGIASKPFTVGNITDQPYLAELVGDNKDRLPVLDAIVQNTNLLTKMNIRNLQARDTGFLLKELGMATVVPVAKGGNAPANVIKFKRDGDLYWIKLDADAFPDGITPELLVSGLQGIKTAIPTAVKMLALPAQLLRKSVTRMPLYVVRQMIRDPLFAWVTTGGNFTPIVSSIKEMTKIRRGLSPTEELLQRSGAISSNVATGDYQDTARMIRDISSGKKGWNWAMAGIDNFAMQADASTRAVLYDSFRKQGMDHVDALLGAAESMNFSRRGTSSSLYMMSTMIPFFNAQLQGLDAMYRTVRGDTILEKRLNVRNTMLKRGAIMTASTLAYAALMQDDEAYKNATDAERAANWFVRLPGVDEAIRVPIPFEPGLMFKAIPEVLFNTMFSDTTAKQAAKAIAQQIALSSPLSMPTALKPAIEVATNYSFFTDTPIESAREQGMTQEQRYRTNTTEIAKLLGRAGVLSPVQIEHLVRGYTSSAGILLMSMANWPLRPLVSPETAERPERKLSELALVGPAFQPNTGRAALDAVYDDIERYEQAHKTFMKLAEEGKMAEARSFASKYATEIAMASTGGAAKQFLGELAAYKRVIASSKELTPKQKQEQIEQVKKYEIAYAQMLRKAGQAAN